MFSLRHPDLPEIKGWVGRWRATFVVELDEPSRCSVEVIVDAASLDTGEAERDDYARSEAFLDVARFPEIRFRSRSIFSENGDRRLTITGDLTVREALARSVSWSNGLRWRDELEGGELVAGDSVDVDLRINVRRGPK